MKKLLLLLLLCSSYQLTFAQDDRFEEAAQFAANHICDCVNAVYADVDSDVRDAMVVMTSMTEEESNHYVAGLDQNLVMRIVEQSQLMLDASKAAEFEACNESMVNAIDEKYPMNYEAMNYTEEDFMDLMFKSLGAKEPCAFTYFLLQYGMRDAEDETENNYHENQSPRKVAPVNPSKSTENGGSEEQY